MTSSAASQCAAAVREQLLLLADARAELVANGISQSAIDSLYPAGFKELLPELIVCLEQATAAEIIEFAHVAERTQKLLGTLPWALSQEAAAAYAESLRVDVEVYVLHNYLAGRLGQPAHVKISERFTEERLLLDDINRGVWQVHWLAVNRRRLSIEQQVEVDWCVQQLLLLVKLA